MTNAVAVKDDLPEPLFWNYVQKSILAIALNDASTQPE